MLSVLHHLKIQHTSQRTSRSGFTLIELLIVIAIIGLLVGAVLFAVNPIEQINKASDSAKKGQAAQLQKAISAHYASEQAWPWVTDSKKNNPNSPMSNSQEVFYRHTFASSQLDWLDELPESGAAELSFVDKLKASWDVDKVFSIGKIQNDDTAYVCFIPKSASLIKEAEDRCLVNPVALRNTNTMCEDGGVVHYCLP